MTSRLTGRRPTPLIPSILSRMITPALVLSQVAGATRRGGPPPDVSSVDALVAALRGADAVLYSRGISGLYIEQMLAKLGLDAQLKENAVQTTSADEALGRLAQSTGNEIAFATVSESRRTRRRGVSLVGPLPPPVQTSTTYAAAVMTGSSAGQVADGFVRFLTTPTAMDIMASTGGQPPPGQGQWASRLNGVQRKSCQ